MYVHPAQLFTLYLLGLSTAVVAALALYIIYRLTKAREVLLRVSGTPERAVLVRPSFTGPTGRRRAQLLLIPLLMLLWVFFGKYLIMPFYLGATVPLDERPAGRSATLEGASGARLAVRYYGAEVGPTFLFTHGWGADQREWAWLMRFLPPDTRMVTWDLPGLGDSSSPRGEQSMASMAADLDSVLSTIPNGPVILVGHSIGGMLNLEFSRLHHEKLGRQVIGIVQANTTYTNPVETKQGAERSRKLQKPVYEPLLHVVATVSPVVRALGWLGYKSGLAHLQLASQSFAGDETWQQLDDMARYSYKSSPQTVARGVLAMMHWDASAVLKQIQVPTLIISGEQDVTTLPAASDSMEKEIPLSRRIRVNRAAHMGPVEKDSQYADAIMSFASTTTAGTSARP